MKWAVLLLLPFFASAESGSNSESTSFSSGANINNQNNINQSDHMIIGDVKCPKPTLGVISGSSYLDGGKGLNQAHIGIGLSIPLFTGDCDQATKLKIKRLEWMLLDAELELQIKKEQHELKMLASCNELKLKNINTAGLCK